MATLLDTGSLHTLSPHSVSIQSEDQHSFAPCQKCPFEEMKSPLTACHVIVQDPVSQSPAVLVKTSNITQMKLLELELAGRQDSLQR